MSDFTDAAFEPVVLPTGKPKLRGGRPVYRIRGVSGNGMTFHVGFVGSGISVHVPEGFETDGPSIPKALACLVPKSAIARAMKAAAVHDLLCEDPRFSRADADAQFWAAMSAEGTPETWRWIFFNAVITNGSKERYNHEVVFDGEPNPGGAGA